MFKPFLHKMCSTVFDVCSKFYPTNTWLIQVRCACNVVWAIAFVANCSRIPAGRSLRWCFSNLDHEPKRMRNGSEIPKDDWYTNEALIMYHVVACFNYRWSCVCPVLNDNYLVYAAALPASLYAIPNHILQAKAHRNWRFPNEISYLFKNFLWNFIWNF